MMTFHCTTKIFYERGFSINLQAFHLTGQVYNLVSNLNLAFFLAEIKIMSGNGSRKKSVLVL